MTNKWNVSDQMYGPDVANVKWVELVNVFNVDKLNIRIKGKEWMRQVTKVGRTKNAPKLCEHFVRMVRHIDSNGPCKSALCLPL